MRRSGRRAEALPVYDEAINFAERSLAGGEDDVHHLATLMFANTNKGYCLSLDGRYAETEEHCPNAKLGQAEPSQAKLG